jgi:hypothetical protein
MARAYRGRDRPSSVRGARTKTSYRDIRVDRVVGHEGLDGSAGLLGYDATSTSRIVSWYVGVRAGAP